MLGRNYRLCTVTVSCYRKYGRGGIKVVINYTFSHLDNVHVHEMTYMYRQEMLTHTYNVM